MYVLMRKHECEEGTDTAAFFASLSKHEVMRKMSDMFLSDIKTFIEDGDNIRVYPFDDTLCITDDGSLVIEYSVDSVPSDMEVS